MFKYLKSAFWHRERLPLVGEQPVNVLSVGAFAALGFGHPLFWWAGAALETGFLFLLSSSRRYQRLVDAKLTTASHPGTAESLESLRRSLIGSSNDRHQKLLQRTARIRELFTAAGSGESEMEHRLAHMEWLHLKLLLALDEFSQHDKESPPGELENAIAVLEAEIAAGTGSSANRSREATLSLLLERLSTRNHRIQCIEEITADLARIEHQVELILEKAILKANPTDVSFTLDFAAGSIAEHGPEGTRDVIRRMDEFYCGTAR